MDQPVNAASSGNYGGPPLQLIHETTDLTYNSQTCHRHRHRHRHRHIHLHLHQGCMDSPLANKLWRLLSEENRGILKGKRIYMTSPNPATSFSMNPVQDPFYHFSMITTPAISAYSRANNDSGGNETSGGNGNYYNRVQPIVMNQPSNNVDMMPQQRQQMMYYDDYRAMQGQAQTPAQGRPVTNMINPMPARYHELQSGAVIISYSQQVSNIPQSFFQKDVFYKEHSLQAAIHNSNASNNRSFYSSGAAPNSSLPISESVSNRSLRNNNCGIGTGPSSDNISNYDRKVEVHVTVNESISSAVMANAVDSGNTNTISGNMKRSEEGRSYLSSLDAITKAGMLGNY